MSQYHIRTMASEDWPEVRRIYQEGISTGDATFEVEAPSWERWNAGHRADCRLIAEELSQVLGWAALSPVSARRVYEGVCEVSIYIGATVRGRGLGRALMKSLISSSEQAGIWTLQAGIFPENIASLQLHKSSGFREVGRRERIGRLGDRWRDVMLLERRSAVAGV